jgi:hypothetical protein
MGKHHSFGVAAALSEPLETGHTKASGLLSLRRSARASHEKGKRPNAHQHLEKMLLDRIAIGSEHPPALARSRLETCSIPPRKVTRAA